MYQIIYDQSLSNRPIIARIFGYLRRLSLRFHDPIVNHTLNGKNIVFNMSHNLPLYQKHYPTYSANLTRLSAFIRTHFGALRMIDVGANIGDSYCLVGSENTDRFLLIEGEEQYFNLLTQNTRSSVGLVTLVQAYLSNKPFIDNANVMVEGGTSRIMHDTVATRQLHYYTLDQIVQSNSDFQSCNLLKVDVDGYDCKVLRGGLDLLSTTKPVIFFEYHPRLLASSDDDAHAIFDVLSKLGYQNLIFYDNFGFLIGTIDANHAVLISDLTSYAMQKPGYYYDICCFHENHNQYRNQFFEQEQAFYNHLVVDEMSVR